MDLVVCWLILLFEIVAYWVFIQIFKALICFLLLLEICVEFITSFKTRGLCLWIILDCIILNSLLIIKCFSLNISIIILMNVARTMILISRWIIFFLVKRIIFFFIFTIRQSGRRSMIYITMWIFLIWAIFCIISILFVVFLVVLPSWDIFINIIVCKSSWCVRGMISLRIINWVRLRFIRIVVCSLRILWVAIWIPTFIVS